MRSKKSSGFTLIELLVVISIIGFLSTLAVVALKSARERARDARRKSDLTLIAKALHMYYENNGHYTVDNSGSNGNGQGWFSYDYDGVSGPYDSVAKELKDLGYVGSVIIDPSGNVSGYNSIGSAYMIRATVTGFTLWTSLENPSAIDTATQNTCYYSDYNNFKSDNPNPFPVNRRMNYCVSYQ
ncbi:MAG: prepilin-type N-terminal cleavage/methylation domain-containing protein [Patescibacteria group bacterium]|jgi:prepilin-type N-terminal cleavage/methylation domain-containing protein